MCIYEHIHICVCVFRSMYMYVCFWACPCMRMCVYKHVHIYVFLSVYMYIYVYFWEFVWTCVMNVYMYMMCVYEHVCTCKDQKRSKPSGAGLTGSCEPSDVSAENETQVHARSTGTLNPELFLQPWTVPSEYSLTSRPSQDSWDLETLSPNKAHSKRAIFTPVSFPQADFFSSEQNWLPFFSLYVDWVTPP